MRNSKCDYFIHNFSSRILKKKELVFKQKHIFIYSILVLVVYSLIWYISISFCPLSTACDRRACCDRSRRIFSKRLAVRRELHCNGALWLVINNYSFLIFTEHWPWRFLWKRICLKPPIRKRNRKNGGWNLINDQTTYTIDVIIFFCILESVVCLNLMERTSYNHFLWETTWDKLGSKRLVSLKYAFIIMNEHVQHPYPVCLLEVTESSVDKNNPLSNRLPRYPVCSQGLSWKP